ncbi:MAG: DUF6143 family protein [Syntrophomonas sp.]|nr:DUF6143 family protein [Syntrophomonas sp.]
MVAKVKSSKQVGKKNRPKEVVSLPVSLEKSIEGKYFVGQSEVAIFGGGLNAWGALINPWNSKVNLYVNVFTVTNITDSSFSAQIWFDSNPPGAGTKSDQITPANTTLRPLRVPRTELRYEGATNGTPQGGVNGYNREIPPLATVVGEEDGKFIIPPGGSYLIFVPSPGSKLLTVRFAFGWWEEKLICNARAKTVPHSGRIKYCELEHI